MRKKWGMILGLTGMMLLGAQSIYAAEAADGTAETTDAANEKETAGADDIESKIKKGGFTAGASVHDPSVIKDNDTYYIFGSHMESAKSTDLRNWTGFSSGVNAENKLFDNLFDGEEDGDPAAFTYVGKNEEGGYSVWAPDVIYNKKMGKYVMYFCTTSSYVKSNICFATADDNEVTSLGIINTRAGVILPGLCGASTIFFFKQYMQSLPKELLDAGRIDGCTEYGISVKIMMPITKPAFASMAILCAMGSWNNMLWPMLVFRDTSKFTLQIGLNTLLTPYGNNYNLLIAGSMFGILPILIIYLIFQRYLIDGMTSGAVKG